MNFSLSQAKVNQFRRFWIKGVKDAVIIIMSVSVASSAGESLNNFWSSLVLVPLLLIFIASTLAFTMALILEPNAEDFPDESDETREGGWVREPLTVQKRRSEE